MSEIRVGEGVAGGGGGGGGKRGVELMGVLKHANAGREFVETTAILVGFGELEEEIVKLLTPSIFVRLNSETSSTKNFNV